MLWLPSNTTHQHHHARTQRARHISSIKTKELGQHSEFEDKDVQSCKRFLSHKDSEGTYILGFFFGLEPTTPVYLVFAITSALVTTPYVRFGRCGDRWSWDRSHHKPNGDGSPGVAARRTARCLVHPSQQCSSLGVSKWMNLTFLASRAYPSAHRLDPITKQSLKMM